MIETRELTRRFGRTVAVDAVTTSVADRGLVGFLGPNGAGKTTTMRMLTGFLPATSGEAVVAGFDVFEAPLEVKARVGYLPEHPPLYPELTVGEYVRFVAEIRGVPRARRLARVGEVLAAVGLTGWEGRRLGTLSKGYRQRVGLAQAIVHDPRLLVLDEPTAGLDPAQVVSVRRLIRELAHDRTVVLSTHVLSEVEALCDRILLLHRGRLVGDGTVDALAERVGRGPWVELALDAPPEDPRGPVAALDVVETVEQLDAGRLRVRGGPEVEPALAALAAARGWRVRALVRHRARLEDVFLALVGEEA
ncbi:MAG: ABC transporter ATP-binding protein [Myxococcota bacterium]